MHPIKHRVLAALLGGAAAGALASLLDHLKAPPPVMLGLCLAVYGVLEKLILDSRRADMQRRVLLETLTSFFEKMTARNAGHPLWSELQRQISGLYEIESSPQLRHALLGALAEAVRLSHHVSFLALQEPDTQSLLRLKKSMELR